MSHYNDVRDFHLKFGVPTEADVDHPQLPSRDVVSYRKNFLQEELDEFEFATENGDLANAADALLDLVYVAYGTALLMGISPDCWNELWNDVQRANMAKERATGADDSRSKRSHSLDVVKPEGWVGPNGTAILNKHGAEIK